MIILLEKQLIKASICLWLKFIFWQRKNRREFLWSYKRYLQNTNSRLHSDSESFPSEIRIKEAWELPPLPVTLPLLCYLPAELKPTHVLRDEGFYFIFHLELFTNNPTFCCSLNSRTAWVSQTVLRQ